MKMFPIEAYFVYFIYNVEIWKTNPGIGESRRGWTEGEKEGSDDEGRKIFLVKQPRWWSNKASGMFQKLDEAFETEIQNKRCRDQAIPRKPGPVSERPQPPNVPSFQ